jgi:hypothetical protein
VVNLTAGTILDRCWRMLLSYIDTPRLLWNMIIFTYNMLMSLHNKLVISAAYQDVDHP